MTTTVSTLPPAPNRNSPSDFSTKADAWVAAIGTWTNEVNTVAGEVNTNASTASTAASAATTQANNASTSATTASNWAIKTDNFVSGSDNSAKSWAIGGTSNGNPSDGSAKDWATKTGSTVAASEYSAKEYANGSTVPTGSAKDWAIKTDGAVASGEYSAKYHAQQAAISAASAINSPNTNATSSTPNTVGLGSKTFSSQTGKSFVPGQWVVIADTSAPSTNYMTGAITSYDPNTGTLAIVADAYAGSGTISSWSIALSAVGGVSLNSYQTLTNKTIAYGDNFLTGVQPTLVSGVNVKTINGTSIMGAGNLSIAVPAVGENVKTTDYTIISADFGKVVKLTGSTSATFTLPVASVVGAGWYCYIQNAGNDTVEASNPVTLTITRSGSDTIDGVASVVEYRGGTLLITSNGTVFIAVRISGGFARFTQTGSFAWPTKVSGATIDAVGAGGSGGKGDANSKGGGGGARNIRTIVAQPVNTSTTATVGAGGAAVTVTQQSGNPGGNTSFLDVLAFGGYSGGGGQAGAGTTVNGGYPSVVTGGSGAQSVLGGGSQTPDNIGGGGGMAQGSTYAGGRAEWGGGGGGGAGGGSSVYGGGGGGGIYNSTTAYLGGTSGTWSGTTSTPTSRQNGAGDGGRSNMSTNGVNGGIPGGGGGATFTGAQSGSGGRGEIRVWYW